MTTVERAHSNREDKVEGKLARCQDECLGFGLADAHPSGFDLADRRRMRLRHRLGRAINGEDVPSDEPGRYGASGRAWPASDLQYA